MFPTIPWNSKIRNLFVDPNIIRIADEMIRQNHIDEANDVSLTA
jgi:propanediol utilization protein